jgi:myo-inositol-1(or 4)-monophosphatase
MKRLVLFKKNMDDKYNSTRVFGTAACAMAFVGSGGVDAFCHLGLHCWDLAAGQLIIEEAGGFLCDYGGQLKC